MIPTLSLIIIILVAPSSAQTSTNSSSVSTAAGIVIAVCVTIIVCVVVFIPIMLCFKKRWNRNRHGHHETQSEFNEVQEDQISKTAIRTQNTGFQSHVNLSYEEESTRDTQSRSREMQVASPTVSITAPSDDLDSITAEMLGRDEVRVVVTERDELMFKMSEVDGKLIVSEDPAMKSKTAAKGIRKGDKIRGVYINFENNQVVAEDVADILSYIDNYNMELCFECHRIRKSHPRDRPTPTKRKYRLAPDLPSYDTDSLFKIKDRRYRHHSSRNTTTQNSTTANTITNESLLEFVLDEESELQTSTNLKVSASTDKPLEMKTWKSPAITSDDRLDSQTHSLDLQLHEEDYENDGMLEEKNIGCAVVGGEILLTTMSVDDEMIKSTYENNKYDVDESNYENDDETDLSASLNTELRIHICPPNHKCEVLGTDTDEDMTVYLDEKDKCELSPAIHPERIALSPEENENRLWSSSGYGSSRTPTSEPFERRSSINFTPEPVQNDEVKMSITQLEVVHSEPSLIKDVPTKRSSISYTPEPVVHPEYLQVRASPALVIESDNTEETHTWENLPNVWFDQSELLHRHGEPIRRGKYGWTELANNIIRRDESSTANPIVIRSLSLNKRSSNLSMIEILSREKDKTSNHSRTCKSEYSSQGYYNNGSTDQLDNGLEIEFKQNEHTDEDCKDEELEEMLKLSREMKDDEVEYSEPDEQIAVRNNAIHGRRDSSKYKHDGRSYDLYENDQLVNNHNSVTENTTRSSPLLSEDIMRQIQKDANDIWESESSHEDPIDYNNHVYDDIASEDGSQVSETIQQMLENDDNLVGDKLENMLKKLEDSDCEESVAKK